jgi:hypothetical protein
MCAARSRIRGSRSGAEFASGLRKHHPVGPSLTPLEADRGESKFEQRMENAEEQFHFRSDGGNFQDFRDENAVWRMATCPSNVTDTVRRLLRDPGFVS